MLNTKLKEAEQVEKNESEEMKAEKFRLSEMLSALRKQKSELKKFCREERKRIETQIEQLDSEKADQNRYKDKMAEIDKELIANQEKHENVRKQLAAVNKRYVLIQRKFDDVPTRAELAQYQKRFLELYNQCLYPPIVLTLSNSLFLFQCQTSIMKRKNSTPSTTHWMMRECTSRRNSI